MKNLLSDDQIQVLKDSGLLIINIPFSNELCTQAIMSLIAPDNAKKARDLLAMAWLRDNYALNWHDLAMVVDFSVDNNNINIKLINSEMLQVVLMESGLGSHIFREVVSLIHGTCH